MARSYIGSAGGFADGFTQGFGLINDAYTGKRKLDMAEEEMAYSRENDRLDREQAQKNFNAEQDAAERRFNAQQTTAQNQYNLDSQRLGIAQTEAQAAASLRAKQATTAETQQAAAQAELEALEQARKNEMGQRAIFQIDAIARRARETGTVPDLNTINDLIKQTEGTLYDVNTVLGSDYQSNLAGLTSTLSTQLSQGTFDPEDPQIVAGFDALINARQGKLIGKVVDDSFVNAPDELKNGKYRVISREAMDIEASEGSSADGPPALEVGANVLVTVENIDDPSDIAFYVAPLTDSREQGSSDQLKIRADQMMDGIAGSAVLANYLQNSGMADLLKMAKVEQMGGSAEFTKRVDQRVQELMDVREARPDSRSILGGGKRNGDLTDDEIRRVAEDKVIGVGRTSDSFRDEATSAVIQTKEALKTEMGQKYLVDVNGTNTPLNPNSFTQKELFLLRSTMGDGGRITKATRDLLRKLTEGRNGTVIDRSFLSKAANALGEAQVTASQSGILIPPVI